jgi:hypothetical protein
MWSYASHKYPLVALVTLGALLLGSAAAQPAQAPDPAPLTLRLTDLPKGWKVGDDSGCGALGLEGATPEVATLVRQFHPQACVREFNELWGDVKPFYVQSLAMTFAEDGGADRALAATQGLLAYHGLNGASPSSTVVAVGDRAQVLVQPKGYPPGPQPSPETAVAWRSGEVYAFVVAAARTQGDATAAAVGYARAQQARIETPTPISDSDFDDLLVPLNNPKLGVPVWWLGLDFDPPGRLPDLHFDAAGVRVVKRSGYGPGQTVDLEYSNSVGSRPPGGARIYIWKPADWKRWIAKPIGQTAWDSPCAKAKMLDVPAGRAVVWSGYMSTPKTRPCPKRARDTFFAHVYGRSVVVTVNIPICGPRYCRPSRGPHNAYDSVAGLEAIVRGLRPRR